VWIHQVSHFKDKHKVHTPELIDKNNIKDFIVKNGLKDICLVGWSLGGMISLKLATELKDKIRHLVLIDTTPRFVQSEDFQCAISKNTIEKIHSRIKTDVNATLEWFYKFCFSPNERSRSGFSEILKITGDFVAPVNQDTLLSGLKFLMQTDLRPDLAGIDMPVLIIHGDQDRVCPPDAARFMAGNIKNAKLAIIENAGHVPFITQPENVNALIENFILG